MRVGDIGDVDEVLKIIAGTENKWRLASCYAGVHCGNTRLVVGTEDGRGAKCAGYKVVCVGFENEALRDTLDAGQDVRLDEERSP